MDSIVKKDGMHILTDVIDILKHKEAKDVLELRELSNHVIHNASVFQDAYSISLTVVVYALSKIIERDIHEIHYDAIITELTKAKTCLQNDDLADFEAAMHRLIEKINEVDNHVKMYVQEVVTQAQVKKGCKLCEHGISIAKAATIMGLSQWDLMNYIGNTNVLEIADGVDIRSRLRTARALFR